MSTGPTKGYKLPQNLHPVNDACMVLYYPDDPLYRRALLGSYTSLGTWGVWEKTGDNSASIAAGRWKASILRSVGKKVSCDVLDELDEDGNMTINVNVNCGCGCGDGDVNVTVNIPRDEPLDWSIDDLPPDIQGPLDPNDPGTPVPPQTIQDGTGIDSWEDFDAYMCDVSHFTVNQFINGLRAIETLSDKIATVGTVVSFLSFLFPGSWLAKAGVAALFELIEAITQILLFELAFDSIGEFADTLEEEEKYNELVCLIYDNRYSLPAAKSEALLKLQQWVYEYFADPELHEAILGYIDKLLPIRWMFHQVYEELLTPMIRGRDCTFCSSSNPDIVTIDYDFSLGQFDYVAYQRSAYDSVNGRFRLYSSNLQFAAIRIAGADLPVPPGWRVDQIDVTLSKQPGGADKDVKAAAFLEPQELGQIDIIHPAGTVTAEWPSTEVLSFVFPGDDSMQSDNDWVLSINNPEGAGAGDEYYITRIIHYLRQVA